MLNKKTSLRDFLPITAVSLLFISQIVVGINLQSEVSQNTALAYIGMGLYVFSGIVFGVLPVFEFRKKGGVNKGKSYIHTTQLVDTGIYSIVRHPQFMTWMWWAVAGMLLFQHWIVVLLGVPIFPLSYIDIMKADQDAVEKFGDDYREYMKRVPRTNFFLGMLRWIIRKVQN